MSASGLLTDWIGRGTHAARPSSPNISSGGTAIYTETDTGNVYAWDGSSWLLLNGGGGGGGSVTYGAGVPDTSPSQAGQLYVATDSWPGMRGFSYRGSFSGLPYVVNRGLLAVSASGSPVITMERTVTSGNLLVAMLAGNNETYASAISGWTSIYNNSGPSYCPAAVYKFASGADTTESPFALSNTSSQIIGVFEIANASAGSPIAANQNSSSSGISVSSGQLVLVMAGANNTNVGPPIQSGQYLLGLLINAQSGGNATAFFAAPQIAPFDPSTFYPNFAGAGGVVVIGSGAATTDYWDPIY